MNGNKRSHWVQGSGKAYQAERKKLGGLHHRTDKRSDPPELLSDEEIAAQSDFIRECREGRHDPFDGRVRHG